MLEIIEALNEGRLKEMFTCGTAVTVSSIKGFQYKEKDYKLEIDEKINSGKLTYEIYKKITDI